MQSLGLETEKERGGGCLVEAVLRLLVSLTYDQTSN